MAQIAPGEPEFWQLTGSPDPARFFASLESVLGGASTIFLEVGSPSREVVAAFEPFLQEGPYVPARYTLWPRALTFRLEFSEASLRCLAAESERRATPEFIDHMTIHGGERELLTWPDSFGQGCPLLVSKLVTWEVIEPWAASLGFEIESEHSNRR